MEAVATGLRDAERPTLIVGGFPVGHFSDKTMKLASEKFRIDRRKLEAWTVVGRAAYDYEKAIGTQRFGKTSAYLDGATPTFLRPAQLSSEIRLPRQKMTQELRQKMLLSQPQPT